MRPTNDSRGEPGPLALIAFALVPFAFFALTSRAESPAGEPGASGPEPRCGEDRAGGKTYSYCLYPASSDANADVVFFFHGRSEANSGYEKLWNSSETHGPAIQARWRERGLPAPAVFAASFGSVWALADREPSPVNVSVDAFDSGPVETARRLLGGFRGRVLAVGESLGGFNSFFFAMRSKSKVAKVASLCPAIADISPWASTGEIEAFVLRHPETDRAKLRLIMALNRFSFPTPAEWTAASPLEVARGRSAPFPFAAHLTGGRSDPFGIFSGAQALAGRIRELGGSVEWVPLDGGHCMADPNAAADFLLER